MFILSILDMMSKEIGLNNNNSIKTYPLMESISGQRVKIITK